MKTTRNRLASAAITTIAAFSLSAQARSYPDFSVHVQTTTSTQYTYYADDVTTVPTSVAKRSGTRVRYFVTEVGRQDYCELYTYLNGREKRYVVTPMSDAALWNTVGRVTPDWSEHTQRKTASPLVDYVIRSFADSTHTASYSYGESNYQVGTKANVSFTGRSLPLNLITSLKGPMNEWYFATGTGFRQIVVSSGQMSTVLSKSLTQKGLTAPSYALPGQTLEFATLPHAVYTVAQYLESKGYRR